MWSDLSTGSTEELIADIQALRDYGATLLETSKKLRQESNHIQAQSLKNTAMVRTNMSVSQRLRRWQCAPGKDS